MYQKHIAACVPSADPRHVEAFMRLEHGNLDGLSRTDFEACAKSCAEAAATDPLLAERLAGSYAL